MSLVSYSMLHKWVKEKKPKTELCEMCNSKPPKELANLSGEYKKDVNDFMWLCLECHGLLDSIIKTKMDSIKVDTFPITTIFASHIIKKLDKYVNKTGRTRTDVIRQIVYGFLNNLYMTEWYNTTTQTSDGSFYGND